MSEGVYMTETEQSRSHVFLQIALKKISRVQAAQELDLSLRQLQRLYASYKQLGIKGLVSKQRGRRGNRQLPAGIKEQVFKLVKLEKYAGFKPTFMAEKLFELHQIQISKETTRQLMIQCGVWLPKSKKCPVIHQQRKRRARFGELVQIDGSPHAWLENRGEPCCLIVYIDDATGRTYGKFFESETTVAYMVTSQEYIIKYGRPLACYADKHGIFRVNMPGCLKKECITQFGRALKELDIELICANTPQAKGRVERANQTLQDRQVKEMRLAGINTIENANQFLLTFWDGYNKKFMVEPRDPQDAHRALLKEHELSRILCHKETRKLSKNLEFQYNNIVYQITLNKPSGGLRGVLVTVLERLDGKISIEYKGRLLPFQEYHKQVYQGKEVDSKRINQFLDRKKPKKPGSRHIWNQQGRAEGKRRAYMSA